MKKTSFSIRAICRIAVTKILLVFTSGFLCGQTNGLNYREIFGEKYNEAIDYLTKNPWITQSLAKSNINPCLAKSVVFPELFRFSYLKDKMEVQALKTLYVQYGQKYANFSVGRFQMKPGFAEKVEADLKTITCFKNDATVKQIDTTQSSNARLERIKRLDSEKWQVQYLIWFIKVMDHKYPNLKGRVTANNVRFISTAYNCGYYLPEKQIRANMTKYFFHTALLSSNEKYNYASVSSFYWSQCNRAD